MSADYEESRFSESTEHWEIDYRQRVKEVIKKEIQECGASLEEVKVAVVEEIKKCRNSTLTENRISEENIFRRIFKFNVISDVLQNIYRTVGPNGNEDIQRPGENERKVTEVSLSTVDHAYIDQKYVKYCSEFWLQEAVAHSTEMIKRQDRNTIQGLLYSIGTIQCLSEIPEPFNELKYYKLLVANDGLIGREDEKTCMDKLKKKIFQLIIVYSHSIKNEVNFCRVFMDFLFAFKNLEDIEAKLQLRSFCYGDSTFDELLDRIINLDVDAYGSKLTALQQEAKFLKQEKELFAADKFKEIVAACLKPVEVQEKRSDGRMVIESTGRCMVMSKILGQLEEKLRFNPAVEEVRIVGADILHIDASIKKEIWRGVNIVIFVDKIKIHNKIVWDVSGKDSDLVYSDNAGTGADGHGKRGADGHAGESGGNVFIQANEVEDPENLTIISNGGRGSSGQDGGDGKDGPDGKGIQRTEFCDKFPSVVKCFASAPERTNLLMKTVENIRGSGTVSCDWRVDSNRFIEATTINDNEITFSFCGSSFNTRFQAFLLFRGSRGQAGGPGGDYGLGGEGGCNGEIITSDPKIVVFADQGAKGMNGKGGWYGRHGKNGWDMGYTDYQTWPTTQFYGLTCNSKLRLEYTCDVSEKVIWCPYQDKYAGITSCRIEHRIERNCRERKNCLQNGERQRETQVTKKKTISRSKTSADYAHHFTNLGRGYIENLQSSLKNINQHALQAMTESAEQQEKVTTEVNVKRHIRSSRQGVPRRRVINPVSARQTGEQNFDSLNCELKSDSLADYLLRLKSSELNRSELDKLFIRLDTFEKSLIKNQELKGNTENSELRDIKQMLFEKYRFAVLQDIAQQLQPYQNSRVNPNLTPKKAAKYLIAVNESETNISHPELGTLDQYLFQNSKRQLGNIFRFLKNESTKSAKEAFKRSVGAFVLRVGDSERTRGCVDKYYKEYKEHSEEQTRSLQIFLTPFLSELQRQEHVFALWAESNKDKAIKFELMTEIRKCKFLNALYNRVDKQLKLVYNWDECCRDKNIRKEYNRHIREQGPFSESYRELLAIIFDINIRLYTEAQDKRFCLLDNHNPGSKQVVYILKRDDKLLLLSIGDNLLKLDEERENQDNLHTKILSETESFETKEEFDDYSLNKKFLPDNDTLDIEYCFKKESDVINIREDYFSSATEERQMIECLEKIAPQFIGHKSILRYILERFLINGRHVSLKELYCLVNSILASVIDDNADLNTFCWIVAAYPQRCWLSELVLRQIENHFQTRITDKSKWRECMLKIENKDILMSLRLKLNQFKSSGRISIQCIEDALILLSKTPNAAVNLEELDLPEWSYALKEKYWTHRLSQLANWQESEKLSEASYYLLSAENTFGTSLVEKFVNILEDKEDLSPESLTEILSDLYNEKSNLSPEVLEALSDSSMSDWMKNMSQEFTADQEDRKIAQLVELVKGNVNTSKEIVDKLPGIQKSVEDMYKEEFPVVSEFLSGTIDSDQLESQQSCEELLYTYRSEIGGNGHSIQQACVKMLNLIDRAIELKRGFKLRDTQKLSILALLANERSTLAQVSTGEGKSLIVVAASIIMIALPGDNKVDIITSSSSLAKRDAEDNKDIYKLFGINVSHNCNEDLEKRREAYSNSQVVYGDLSSFQRDYLLDRFYGKNILGDRNFGNVIVDEVDSMLLDKGNNILYLSHDLAGFDKLESVYLYIWQWVNSPARITEEFSTAFDAAFIKDAVLSDLHGRIAKKDIQKLGSELDEQHTKIIWESLIDAKILDDQGKILKRDTPASELNVVLSPTFSGYGDRLCYMIHERIERRRFIQVPNYLKPFIEQHLESWINSAIMAVAMKQGHDYVLDVDRTGTSPDLNPNVTILDRDTGTDQASSQWDEALHQFLQLKHGCKLSLQSLKAVFISNVRYLKLYGRLYGLTGTLGSHRERDLLKEIHGVDFVTIPRSKPRQFHEEMPTFCSDRSKWIEQVFIEATKFTNELKRSVLIICETIDDVETFQRHFKQRDTNHVYTYTRDYEKFDIAEGSGGLRQGQIIIATNLSGRGTDIKITEELEEAGGLHVCLTYLPNNSRIEQQAFGRAARNGNKGSGRLIVMGSKGQARDCSDAKILDLKKERDAEELRRISEVKAHYETRIIREEYFFAEFKCQYERLKQYLADNGSSTTVQKILLQSCLDKWAFWLDTNSECIQNLTDDQTERYFEDSLKKFTSQLKNLKYEKSAWLLPWVEEYPVQMIKLGKQLCQDKIYDDAIKLFDEAIEREPCFSEAAHYYKAYALVKKIDWAKKPLDKRAVKELKKELREAARLFDERRDFSICAGAIINNIKQHDNKSIIQIDAYAEQQESLSNLYYLFSQSIGNVFGPLVTPESFVNDDIDAELSELLYEDLLRHDILKKPKLKGNASEDTLRKVSIDYGIPAEKLNNLLSTFRGEEIDEKKFQMTLKEGLKLASREDFWKLLVEHNILDREVNCVVVHVNRLQDADPTLFQAPRNEIFKYKLQRQTLKCRRNEILLNVLPAGDQRDYIMFEKNTFKSLIDVNDGKKYAFLKNKGIFTFNKRARINLSKIAQTALPRYDSITLEDFSNENIATNDAVKILAELYHQKILAQKDSKSCVYRMKILSSEIEKIKLPSFPIYENTVKSLLLLRFAYRVALEKIEKQIRENRSPVHPRLPSKPHFNVICELLDQRVIRLAKVNVKVGDLENQLSNIYSLIIGRDHLKLMLYQNGLITTEAKVNALRDHLVEKRWLRVNSSATDSHSDPECKFSINDPKAGQPLDPTVVAYDIRVKIERALKNRFQLAKKNTIAHIIKILEQSKSMLKTLEFPDSNLKPLTECSAKGEFKDIGEIDMLTLNGLAHLLQVSEKKWTKSMLCNTLAVVMMGMCQIAISFVLEVCCTTSLSETLFLAGFYDVLFALKSLKSGYFRWEDYASYKRGTVIANVCNVILSKLSNRSTTQKSYFGNKIIGPLLEFGMETVRNVFNQLNTAKTNGAREAEKCVAWKVAEGGIEFGLAHMRLDAVIEHQLKILCDRIESSILSSIENEVDKVRDDDSFAIVEEIYQKLGKDFAMKTINYLTHNQRSVTEQSFRGKISDIAAPIVCSVINEITQATANIQQTSTSIHTSPIQDIRNVVAGVSQPVPAGSVQKITRDILEDLLDHLKDQFQLMLDSQQVEDYADPKFPEQEQEAVLEREIFNCEVFDQWKSLLLNAAGEVIKQQIVNPIFDEGFDHLIGHSKKMINIKFRSYRRGRNKERFEELRKQYPVLLPDCDLPKVENYTVINEYHENLLKLAGKTRNRKLFAGIIRENSPMDLNCLDICTRIIRNMLGIGVIVRVKEKGSFGKRNISSEDRLVDEQIIELVLTDTCFNIECLYDALSHQRLLPTDITLERFRIEVADRIEQDPDIKYHIEHDWPKVFTHSPSFDGRHQIKMVTDELWTDVIDENVKLLQCSMRHGRNNELNKHVEESSSEYSNKNKTARERRWTSLDCGLSFSSRDIAIEDRQGHYETLKIAAQQIRELNLNFRDLSRNRRPPSGRSKSLERLA